MSPLSKALRREARVVFSRRAQPVWFRVVKWTIFLACAIRYHARPLFWQVAAGVCVVAFALHFFYRWKTKAWTHPWGGWHDVAAAREIH